MSGPIPAPAKAPRLDGTIVKGMALIEYMAAQDQPLGVSAMALHFQWQKSNVHRLLTTLKTLGYVRQDPATSRYELSLKTWELGMKVVGRSAIRRAAQPFMRELHQQFQESVNLSVLVGSDVLYLDSILSPHSLRPASSPGARVPAIFTASGKSQLAFRSDAVSIVSNIVATRPEAARLALPALRKELKQVRQRGYALSVSGWRAGINSVAVPIQNRDGHPLAAIGINGPAERLPIERMQDITPALLLAAAQIAEVCGSG